MNNLILIDLETTGTDPDFHEIIEIGGIKIKNMNPVDEFCTFVNPKRKLSPEIVDITGIRDDDLKSAPEKEEAIDNFKNFIGDTPLLAHNMDFDRSFIEKEGIKGPFLDSLDLSCMLFPIEKKHTQEYLLKKICGVSYEAHRALEDAKNLFTLYKRLLDRAKKMDERVKKEIRNALKRTDWEFKEIFSFDSSEDDYLTEKAEKAKFCPKNLPENAEGIPMAHLMSWLFYTETGNLSEISYWVRRKYESFFKRVSIKKCKGKCNYFNNNGRLF